MRDIEEWLGLAKIPYISYLERQPFGGKFYATPSAAGVSDLIGYIPRWRHAQGPLPFFIEVKRAKGATTSIAQMLFRMGAWRLCHNSPFYKIT
ncbi:MAG: hypothetical protein H0X25_23700 [Acidobacteriales bacterium]|nr:hypothetical protein [Terriglobales bacterium]